MDLPERVEALIAPSVTELGYSIVRVQLSGKQSPVLQIMAEPVEDRPMTVDDCATVSRTVSALLDVEDVVPGAYSLEVSSPGLDRPLVRLDDFQRFAGAMAKVEMVRPIDGRRRFRGRLLGVAEDVVRMAVDGATVDLAFADIVRAKLIVDDDAMAS